MQKFLKNLFILFCCSKVIQSTAQMWNQDKLPYRAFLVFEICIIFHLNMKKLQIHRNSTYQNFVFNKQEIFFPFIGGRGLFLISSLSTSVPFRPRGRYIDYYKKKVNISSHFVLPNFRQIIVIIIWRNVSGRFSVGRRRWGPSDW